jgi:hypothetical protein
VGTRAGLDDVEKKNSSPYCDSNSDPSVVQPVASRYIDCAIPAPDNDAILSEYLESLVLWIVMPTTRRFGKHIVSMFSVEEQAKHETSRRSHQTASCFCCPHSISSGHTHTHTHTHTHFFSPALYSLSIHKAVSKSQLTLALRPLTLPLTLSQLFPGLILHEQFACLALCFFWFLAWITLQS